VRIKAPATEDINRTTIGYDVLRAPINPAVAKVSIVTTVYDRVACLESCLRSVQALNFKDYEHIIVADAPPAQVLRQIEEVTDSYGNSAGRLTLANLRVRKNDWGISPATVGLGLARGEYLCFLSDDNGYAPDHFDKLVAALDQDSNLGFVYSSCLYDGRLVLNASVPGHGRIDLGQPLFRRNLFQKHLADTLPFREISWDWKMIESFMRKGVRWAHVDKATFIFRLARYPQLAPAASISR
jgi:glycosyltransferase involved in cell wall biosynthesis